MGQCFSKCFPGAGEEPAPRPELIISRPIGYVYAFKKINGQVADILSAEPPFLTPWSI